MTRWTTVASGLVVLVAQACVSWQPTDLTSVDPDRPVRVTTVDHRHVESPDALIVGDSMLVLRDSTGMRTIQILRQDAELILQEEVDHPGWVIVGIFAPIALAAFVFYLHIPST